MGKLLPNYKKSIIDDMINGITSNTAHYYAFTSFSSNTLNTTADDSFINDWQLLFGKKLTSTNIIPVIKNIIWSSNTVYDQYDNTQDLSNSNFYVVVNPGSIGGSYNIFKCIGNANGVPSTSLPDQIQSSSFKTSDGYIWRYITSISSFTYDKFATLEYVPVYPNNSIVSTAYDNSGIDNLVIMNNGNGYSSYSQNNTNIVLSSANSTLIQIQPYESTDNDFYTLNSIYLYNTSTTTSQIRNISKYVSNSSGNWVYLDFPANLTNITPSVTKYLISPRVIFNSDGDVSPVAYSVVNTISKSIESIQIIDSGYGITWATVRLQSNNSYPPSSSQYANVYAICPPPGGHGSSPATELFVQGMGVNFAFNGSEGNTIPIESSYTKIGIVKNPYTLTDSFTKGVLVNTDTFNSVLKANVSPLTTFTVGDVVTGSVSGARGTVVFSNNSTVFLTGDKYFSNNEQIYSNSGNISATITINTRGNIYTKDLLPIYVQDINKVSNRNENQSESFKMIIKI